MNQELHTCVSMQILTNMSQLADHDIYGPSHLLKSIFFKKVLKPFSPNVGRVAQRKKKFMISTAWLWFRYKKGTQNWQKWNEILSHIGGLVDIAIKFSHIWAELAVCVRRYLHDGSRFFFIYSNFEFLLYPKIIIK